MRNIKYRAIVATFVTLLAVAAALLAQGVKNETSTIIERGNDYLIRRVDFISVAPIHVLGLWILLVAIVFAADALIMYLE